MSYYPPIKSFTRLHNQIHQARAASERVFELLAMTNSVPEPAGSRRCSRRTRRTLNFKTSISTTGRKPVLRNIQLTVKSGQLVALVGASGSGKTTLTNLLLRFYDPVHGAIKIGGVDLRDVSTRDLRNGMAVVAQENILFNDTIRRNIEAGAAGRDEMMKLWRPQSMRMPMSSSCKSPRVSTRSSAKRGCRFRAASASASPLRARS